MASVVLWGLDGTLVDNERLREAALVEALATVGSRTPIDCRAIIAGRDTRDIHRWCVRELGLGLGFEDWRRLMYRHYFARAGSLSPREGAVDLFVHLERHGRAQAVVANSDRRIVQANLDALGLNDSGRITVSRNDVRCGKPAPEPHRRAAWLLGAAPAECVVVEDSPTGAAAGVAAEMRTLFWPQTETPTPKGAERVTDMAGLWRALA